MLRIAHIVNPVKPGPESDLVVAQPVTFESMRRARDFVAGSVEVSVVATHFAEDAEAAPAGFLLTPHLDRSVAELQAFARPRRLPLLRDILDRLHQSTAAEWLIYTNADIAILPHFYATVAALIGEGYDAFVINRRTIPAHYTSPAQLPLMYAEVGDPHPGHDCFVFNRSAYEKYVLGNVCIGIDLVGRVLLWNLCAHSRRFREFTDLHLTFHIGNTKAWKNPEFADYRAFNAREAGTALAKLLLDHGPFTPADSIFPYLPVIER
jgi:hypothetical protein